MAFDYTNLYPDTSANGGYTKSWNYTTVTDSIATCSASGYFNKVATRLGIGDNIVIARVDAFDTKNRTTLVEYAELFVTGISGGVVTTANYISGIATTAYVDAATALKANLASPTLTGTPAAPTAAVDTNTTQIATTAMVLAQAASAAPLINGVAAAGTTTRFARADHIHPVDTSRQAVLTAGQLPGEPSTGSATAGNVGEYVESVIASGSAVALTTATAKTITSISLTAGDWDVSAMCGFTGGATTTVGTLQASISLTTNTTDLTLGRAIADYYNNATVFANTPVQSAISPVRMSLSATTTIYLVEFAGFGVSTLSGYGLLRARRVR